MEQVVTYLFEAQINSGRGSPRIDWSTGAGSGAAGLIAPEARPAEQRRRQVAWERVADRRAHIDQPDGWSSRRRVSSAACTCADEDAFIIINWRIGKLAQV